MSLHLAEIARYVTPGAHAVSSSTAPAGMAQPPWSSRKHLPPPSSTLHPKLNPVENVWQYLRQNQLGLRV